VRKKEKKRRRRRNNTTTRTMRYGCGGGDPGVVLNGVDYCFTRQFEN